MIKKITEIALEESELDFEIYRFENTLGLGKSKIKKKTLS